MNEQSGAIIIGIAVVTTIKNIADGVLAWLSRRDQLRADSEKSEMKMKLDACEKHHKESEEQVTFLRIEVEQINRRLSELYIQPPTSNPPSSQHKKLPKQPPASGV